MRRIVQTNAKLQAQMPVLLNVAIFGLLWLFGLTYWNKSVLVHLLDKYVFVQTQKSSTTGSGPYSDALASPSNKDIWNKYFEVDVSKKL